MKTFWLKFTDGSAGCCQGNSEYDAKIIAEKLTGKEVAGEQYSPDVMPLPYPANPVIWQVEHPVYGKTPAFCTSPEKCKGRGSCPQNYACTE